MKNIKQRYYNLKNILKVDCPYNLLFGERSNGKSYQVKKYVIEQFFTQCNKFILVRRYKEEFRNGGADDYFDDKGVHDYIIKLSKGQYDSIIRYQGKLYLANTDDEGNVERGAHIGYIAVMSNAHYYKSRNYESVSTIIYEEFMTKGMYIQNEPAIFMDFVSTVFRRRMGKVFMVANTVSRVSPYIREWGLEGLKNQKQGTIDIYHKKTGQKDQYGNEYIINVAVEYCESTSESITGMVFGNKMITSGEWDVDEYPHIPTPYKQCDILYNLELRLGQFDFVLQMLADGNGVFLYVRPLPENTCRTIRRVLSDVPAPGLFNSRRLNPRIFEIEGLIIELIKQGKIYYADNQTGTDFNQSIKEYGGIY